MAHGGLAHFLSFEQTVVMYSTADSVKGKAVRRGRRLVNCGTDKPGLEVRRSARPRTGRRCRAGLREGPVR